MANAILSPVTLWENFDDTLPLKESVVKETVLPGERVGWVLFSGRETAVGRVRIFATYSGADDSTPRPAILLLPDAGKHPDAAFCDRLVKEGYRVLAPDFYGQCEGKEVYTQYPSDVSYANYELCGRRLSYADETAKETCYYEWTALARYALAFLRSRPEVDAEKIMILGVRGGAVCGWQLAATTDLAGAALVGAAGWDSYRDCPKYSDKVPDLGEERFRWVAGIEAQSYAPYVRCPVLFLGSSNDAEYCFDRARDTLTRVKEGVPVYEDFTPNAERTVDEKGQSDLFAFFRAVKEGTLPEKKEIKIDVLTENGKVILSAETECAPENIETYYSCGEKTPLLRTWEKATFLAMEENENGERKLRFSAPVTRTDGIFLAYARVKIGEEWTVSTSVAACDLSEKGVEADAAAKRIIYSETERQFLTAQEAMAPAGGFFAAPFSGVTEKEGAMEISGATAKYGLKYLGVAKNAFTPDTLVLLDVYAPRRLEFTVSLAYSYGKETERRYETRITLGDMDSWQKVALELKQFKTTNNLPFKETEAPDAVLFTASDDYLVNNILWIS